MDADDEQRARRHGPAQGVVVGKEGPGAQGHGDHPRVEDGCHGTPAGAEDQVRDEAREDSSKDPGHQEDQPPMLLDEDGHPFGGGLLGVDEEPVHDPVAEHARTELDPRDGEDHRVGEHFLEHRLQGKPVFLLVRRGVAQVEVLETRPRGLVPDDRQVDQEEEEEKHGRDEEDPPGPVPLPGSRPDEFPEGFSEPSQGFRGRGSGGGGRDDSADVEGHVDPRRDQDPEDAPEGSSLPHVEPVGVDLHDGHGPETLEIHVARVEKREDQEDRVVARLGVEEVHGGQAQEEVHDRRPGGGHEDGEPASQPVRKGSVEKEGDPIDHGPDPEDPAELFLGHQVAQGGLGHGQVVPAHVEEHVGEPQGQPVGQAPGPEGHAVNGGGR